MRGNQTKDVLSFIALNPGRTMAEINRYVNVGNIRMILKRLRDRGEIVQDQGKYFKVSIPDERIVDELKVRSEGAERQEYLKEFLNVVVESIRTCTDHNIKILYIQEGRRLVKDLR